MFAATVRLSPDMSSGLPPSPVSVLAMNHKYLPLRSKRGECTSLRPSVICLLCFLSSEYTNAACRLFGRFLTYVTHLLSGDHDGSRSSSSYRLVSIFTAVG